MRKLIFATLAALAFAQSAFAVPETVSVRVTDVTTSSFAVVWMTDVAATPAVEVYSDQGMQNRLTDTVICTAMPDASQEVAAAARGKGVMKLRVAGLVPGTSYYVRTVTVDPASSGSIGYSGLQQVTTATAVLPYRQEADGTLLGSANDLAAFKVYVRPHDPAAVPGLGELILLETDGARNPVSAFVGAGVSAPEGVLDLNNLFGTEMTTLFLQNQERALLSVYRGGTLSTLVHYRTLPGASNAVSVVEPAQGFFADLNLDGTIDDQDFQALRKQYRTAADDAAYNPDFDFVDGVAGVVDIHDFARFAREYGRAGVQ